MQYVFCRTEFEGIHRWKDAPDEVAFLREWHRHIFHVKLVQRVTHDDRQVEFILLKRQVEDYIQVWFAGQFDYSCEQIAQKLLIAFKCDMVEVSEDGENGAWVTKDPEVIEMPKYWTRTELNKLPSMKLNSRIFIGLEVEGPFREQLTLFIPGSVTAHRVTEVLKSLLPALKDRYKFQFYYGAGNNHLIKESTLRFLAKAARECGSEMYVEYNHEKVSEDLSSNAFVGMNVVCLGGYCPAVVAYDKTVDTRAGTVTWKKPGGEECFVSQLDDPLYAQDVFLEGNHNWPEELAGLLTKVT
jgi:hypothetical protein